MITWEAIKYSYDVIIVGTVILICFYQLWWGLKKK